MTTTFISYYNLAYFKKFQVMDTRNDYTGFSGRQYLNDYFSANGKENKFLMKFLHESYLQIPKSKTLIEIGGGPTIYQILSAR